MLLEEVGWIILWAVSLVFNFLSTYFSVRHLRSSPPHLDTPFALFPISILKPLKGIDEGIEENLESFFNLNYPAYELLFSIADSTDPVTGIVERLMRKYPQISAHLFVGERRIGPNPKINNLANSYYRAKNDWLLISDSNIRVKSDYLRRMFAHVEPGVGLVTSVVRGQNPEGLGGHLETIYLSGFCTRTMVLANTIGLPCVLGKSMLFRRSIANRFGGVETLAQYLAEDYMAGQRMKALGLRTVTATDPIYQYIGNHTLKKFWSRHLRWGRIRKAQTPLIFLIEPIFSAVPAAILCYLGFRKMLGIYSILLVVLNLIIWSSFDFLVLHELKIKFNLRLVLVWFLREALALPLWICIASGNTVVWRGRKLALHPGGMLKV